MKERSYGPQKWALVVISGGAACALPFVNTNEPSTSELHQSHARAALSANDAADVDHMTLAVPPPQLPEWANADRSPFDDLVGVKAREPAPVALAKPLPLEPLRPWISGPASTPSAPAAVNNSIAGGQASPATSVSTKVADDASPWRDRSDGWSAASAAATSSASMLADTNAFATWPDQKLSPAEIARLTQPPRKELASAIVSSPIVSSPISLGQARPENIVSQGDRSSSMSHSSIGSNSRAVVTLPASGPVTTSSQASMSAELPRHAIHETTASALFAPSAFAPSTMIQSDVPPSLSAASTSTSTSTPPALSPAVSPATQTATGGAPLPKLPEARKQHIIFQPSPRR